MALGLRFLQEGGGFMYLNLLCLACALALVGERLYVFFVRYRLDADAFMTQITKLVSSGNVDRALKVCAMEPQAPLARVMRAGLSSQGRGGDAARSFDAAILALTPELNVRLGWLWSLANLATLLGLAGTVVRVISLWRSLGGLPAEARQRALDDGMSAATNHLLFGLAIAVVCVLAHRLLTSLGKQLLGRVEVSVGKVENQLGRAKGLERSA